MLPIFRVGLGYNVRKSVEGHDLWLGGIKMEYSIGLLGYSDTDVLIHATYNALLGAANMRDIGYHFPGTSDETLNTGSRVILQKTMALIATKGYQLGNVNVTVYAEQPKINPRMPAMKSCLARLMQIDEDDISIRAATSERMGSVGRQGGIAAYATVLIVKA